MRFSHAWNNKFAVKATVSYVEGEDWHATDYRDMNYLQGDLFLGVIFLLIHQHFQIIME